MIIFDLDGTLANCEHRRHFVDGNKSPILKIGEEFDKKDLWKPDWKSFYEACDKDDLIIPVAELYERLWRENDYYKEFQIWSGRCESVRKKTEKWLDEREIRYSKLKMRPIRDNTPDDILKERWLNERCSDLIEAQIEGRNPMKHDIDFVFDDRPKVIRMWRRRGIFVFNCCQHDEEF